MGVVAFLGKTARMTWKSLHHSIHCAFSALTVLNDYFAATQNAFHQPVSGHFILFRQFLEGWGRYLSTLGHSSGLIIDYIIQNFKNKYNT